MVRGMSWKHLVIGESWCAGSSPAADAIKIINAHVIVIWIYKWLQTDIEE